MWSPMIKRIKIKDYMAHEDTDLELGPGVTVLTGPNSSGKSAVVEALRSVAQNPVSTAGRNSLKQAFGDEGIDSALEHMY
jgi:predicted ATP-dependent endonuclease of OLD family